MLEEEIQLREETRGLGQAREALTASEFGERCIGLAITQIALQERDLNVIDMIRELPQGDQKFRNEIGLLMRVAQVMDEAQQILVRPDAGPEAIAAETEVIELLMQTKRIQPNSGGGGGGGTTPGGGGSGETDQPALALIGSGADKDAHVEQRQVGQATGVSGRTLPEEFRSGLDSYFDSLEGRHRGGSE